MSESNVKATICQLTTGHSLNDERILHRMAWSGHRLGYRSLVAGPADVDGEYAGVELVAAVAPVKKGLLSGRIFAWIRLLVWALNTRILVFQIHDPDLIPTGLVLRVFGRKVIYDVHDDYQASIETRIANRRFARLCIPVLWWWFERNAAWLFNGVIVADRHLAEKFSHCRPATLGNYPRFDFTARSNPSEVSTFNILYVGGVTRERGLEVALNAIRLLTHSDIRFHVIGRCRNEELRDALSKDPRVILHGQIDWTELGKYYSMSHLGLALYQPLPCFTYYTGENAVKIIEYMAGGIPVITSDFPGLRSFVQETGVGVVVDPTDSKAVASQIEHFYLDRVECTRLGNIGRTLFESDYNWESHEPKLAELYKRVLGTATS